MICREPRNVERQIEPDDRGAEVVGAVVEQSSTNSDTVRSSILLSPANCFRASNSAVSDRGWVIEESGFVEFVPFTELICANPYSLRCVDSGFVSKTSVHSEGEAGLEPLAYERPSRRRVSPGAARMRGPRSQRVGGSESELRRWGASS